ncbi:hypothetical protein HII17_09670 [Thalassotalea sp. M1531]|uniref:DUF3157 family protein n=1 Tax=Thalassotalea algicola TaxID=2716224 RepID=A0A7Y0Q7F6_9GAMM|nr:hypothetical protein [Thalassotalea algicola]NMP31832.1 hypothetical protein [Thalassotalea algicola]
MKIFIVILLCLFSLNAFASQKAVTENGDVVILKEDGTWSYEEGKASAEIEIPVNTTAFKKDKKSNFALKSSKTNSSFSINPKKWKFKKNENGHESAEYTFQLKNGDLYGMAISEQVEIDVEELAKIAFDNARDAAPDTKIVKKEYRTVNGHKVIYMEMVGSIQSIKFKYLGYYYSNSSGSTQYLTYTSTNLVEKYKTEIDRFLNGFSII